MQRVTKARIWRNALASCCILLATSACFPKGNIAQRMPLMATWTESGDIEVVFPLCRGEVMANLALTGQDSGKGWALRNGDSAIQAKDDDVIDLEIGDSQISSGSLSDRWPVIEALESGHPTDIRKFDNIYVHTTHYSAGIYISQVGEAGSWLIEGDAVEHHASPVKVTHAEGLAQIGSFCEAQRS